MVSQRLRNQVQPRKVQSCKIDRQLNPALTATAARGQISRDSYLDRDETKNKI